MVMRTTMVVLATAMTVGCSLLNAGSTHTERFGADAGTDGGAFDGSGDAPDASEVDAPDASDIDAPLSPPGVRVAHLSRDSGVVDVFANGALIAGGLDFATVSEPVDVPAGTLAFRVERAGTVLVVPTDFVVAPGRQYTLTFFGDEVDPPVFMGEAARTLGLLLLDDDASGLDTDRDIRLAVIHVASPVIAGRLVAVRSALEGGNLVLARTFGFRAVAPIPMLPSSAYLVGFDAQANGTVDVTFDIPKLFPGTYANVFVAARTDGSVFLLANTQDGATEIIEAN